MKKASKDILLDSILDLFNDEEFKNDFIQKVNKNVDIPLISEKTEKKVIKALYKVIVEQVELAVKKIQE